MVDSLGVVGNRMGIASGGGGGWTGGRLRKLGYVKSMSSSTKLSLSMGITNNGCSFYNSNSSNSADISILDPTSQFAQSVIRN